MEKTEYKVGEEFQVGFKTLKCVEGEGCEGCFLRERFLDCCILEEFIGPCISYSREDGKDVIFVEVKGDETQYQVEGVETKNLIRDLISALNGDEYEEARRITEQIIATGDEELIKEAEEVNSVL